MSFIDKKRFVDGHYLGLPASFNDRIVKKRIELLLNIPEFTGKSLSLIDIGCGNGASSIKLAKQFSYICAADVEEQNLTEFNALKKSFNAENVMFKLFDIEKDLFEENSFDRLISFEVIEHLRNELSVINYFKILKSGGIAAISVPNKWWIFETHGAKLPLLPWNRVPFFSWLPTKLHEKYANARIYTINRITSLLKSVGFEIISSNYIKAPLDVLPEGQIKDILLKTLFKGTKTKVPFLSTSIFIVVKKPLK